MEKLVRDKIIEFSQLAQDGRKFRIAVPQEIPMLLAKKLVEEAHEVGDELVNVVPSNTHIIEELGDIYEVLGAIERHFNLKRESIVQAMVEKAERKGTFHSNFVLDMSTDSFKKDVTPCDQVKGELEDFLTHPRVRMWIGNNVNMDPKIIPTSLVARLRALDDSFWKTQDDTTDEHT